MRWITLAIAAYAGLVATVDLVWRILERRKANASLVKMELGWGASHGGIDSIHLAIYNLSPIPIWVDRYGVSNKGAPFPLAMFGIDDDLEIPGRDGGVLEQPISVLDFMEMDWDRPIVFWIHTSRRENNSPRRRRTFQRNFFPRRLDARLGNPKLSRRGAKESR